MKKILLLAGVMVLLATGGCIVAEEGRYHDHGRYHEEFRGHAEVVVPGPVVVVPR